jgi:hypothetical protein
VVLHALLTVAPIRENPEPVLFSDVVDGDDSAGFPDNRTSEKAETEDESRFYGKWRKKTDVVARRNLHCTASQNFGNFLVTWPEALGRTGICS